MIVIRRKYKHSSEVTRLWHILRYNIIWATLFMWQKIFFIYLAFLSFITFAVFVWNSDSIYRYYTCIDISGDIIAVYLHTNHLHGTHCHFTWFCVPGIRRYRSNQFDSATHGALYCFHRRYPWSKRRVVAGSDGRHEGDWRDFIKVVAMRRNILDN